MKKKYILLILIKETQVLEALLTFENNEDKKALRDFIVNMYAEEKGLTKDRYKEIN